MPLLPPLITHTPNAQPLYASSSGGGGGSQVLSQTGNSVLLSGGGGSVNIATTTLVAGTAVKTTAMSYDGGILSTTFAGNVLVRNDLEVGTPLDPGRVFVDGTVEPTTITDSAGLVGTAGQVLSAGAAGGSLLWTTGGGGGGGVASITAGSNVNVDSTIPSAPVVSVAISADLDMNAQDILDAGSITCGTLNYTTLNPPVSSGGVASVTVGANGLVLSGTTADPELSLPTATAIAGQYLSTDSTGKFVVGGNTSVILGRGSSGTDAVAIGVNNTARPLDANVGSDNNGSGGGFAKVMVGREITASGDKSVSIGSSIRNNVANAIVIHTLESPILQSAVSSLYVKPVIAKTTETDVLYYDSTSGLVSYGAGGGGGGGVASVTVGANGLVLSGTTADPELSLPTATAIAGQYLSTDSTGKFVVGGNTSVILGRGSSGTDAVAIGINNTARPFDANVGSDNNGSGGGFAKVMVGREIVASGDKSVSIGSEITNNVANAIVINGLNAGRLQSAVSSLYVKPVIAKTTETDVLYYDSASGLVSYGAGGGGGGLPATTTAGEYLVSNGSAYVTAGTSVNLGNGSTSAGLQSVAIGVTSASAGNYGVATGVNASASGVSSIAIGNASSATEQRSIAIGASASALNINSIVINASTAGLSSDRASLYVKPIIPNIFGDTTALYYNQESGLVTYGEVGGLPATTTSGQYLVSNGSAYVTAGDSVNIGTNSSAIIGTIAIGTNATSAGSESIVLGKTANSSSSAINSVCIGRQAATNESSSIAIGNLAVANHVNAIALGTVTSTTGSLHVKPVVAKTTETDVLYYNASSGLVSYGAGGGGGGLPATTTAGEYLVSNGSAYVTAGSTVHLGNGSTSSGANSVALGTSTSATGASAIAMGNLATCTGAYGMSVGYQTSSGNTATAVGVQASATGDSSVAVGHLASSVGSSSVAVGNSSSAGVNGVSIGFTSGAGVSAVSVGELATATGLNSVALGKSASCPIANSISLNATGVSLPTSVASLYVKPVLSNAVPASTDILYYASGSGLVTYGAPANFRATNTYYVAQNGLDTNTGSFGSPWLTIQHAITTLEAIPVTEQTIAVITIAPGHYTENLVFTKGYMALTSMLDAQDANEITEVTGNISVAITTGTSDIFNRQVILEGLSITGNLVDTSTVGHTLYLQNCYMYCSPTSIGLNQNSSVDNRTRLNNTTFVHASATADTNALININSGDCYMTGCSVTARSNAPALYINGTGAVVRCGTTTFEYGYASVAGAIVRVNNTRLSAFGQCGFSALTAGGSVVALNVTTLGTAGSGVNFVQNILVVSGVASHAVTNVGIVYYGGNWSAPGTATGYSSNPTSIAYSAM